MTFLELVNREDLAWAAGLFEGEGHVGMHGRSGNRSIVASLNMTDEDVVKQFQRIVNVGVIYPRPPQKDGWKPQWCWKVGSFEEVQAIIAMLWPWLQSRRKTQAKTALTSYHNLEPVSVKQGIARNANIKEALKTIQNVPLWGRRWRSGKTQRSIAREFGVSPATVTHIKEGGALRTS